MSLPRLLVIDDLFGRPGRDRVNLCFSYGLRDVEDDQGIYDSLPDPLAEAWFCTGQRETADDVRNDVGVALDAVTQGWPFADGRRWALVLLDLRFVSGKREGEALAGRAGDDRFGLEILRELKARFPALPVVVLSSLARGEVIEACRALGAEDFIQRHGDPDAPSARDVLREKLHLYGLLEDARGMILGRSLPLLQTLAAARRAAAGGGNVLLYGESGTGKELLARYLHDHSPRARGPYVIFHPFGVAESLMEDELFGHEKGAFTGAAGARPGLFEQADGGTLFIDEVGDIPESVQNRLLRPIESRVVVRQGGSKEREVDLKVVLATNKDLEHYAESGRFKNDLLNRIRAYTIELPPLSQRPDDIPVLVEGLLERLCREHDARWPRRVAPEALARLQAHDWREGNVRALRNVLEHAIKERRDSELLLANDLVLSSAGGETPVEQPPAPMEIGPRSAAWLNHPPLTADYDALEGLWPGVEAEISELLTELVRQSCRATMRRRPGGREVNLAGAVGCLLGKRVSSLQAADFIKRLLRFAPTRLEQLLETDAEIAEIYHRAARIRPARKKPKN